MVPVVKNLHANARDARDVNLIPAQEDPLEKKMATQFRVLAWETPRTEKPCRLQSMGSQKVGHDLATKQQEQHLINSSSLVLFNVLIS